MKRFLQLLRTRPGFRRLWLGDLVSLLGDWLSYVALSLLAMQEGGGAFALAVVFTGHVLPHALMAPFAGVLADSLDKRSVLVATQVLQGLVVVAMIAAALMPAIVLVQVLLFVRTSIGAMAYPARQAAIAELVEEDEILDANALDAATWSVAFAFGTALGGVVALAGITVALTLDAVTFAAAAVIYAGLPALKAKGKAASVRGALARTAAELRVAVDMATERPRLLEALLSKTPGAIAIGGGWLLLNLRADEIGLLGSAALAVGLLQGVRGIGTGVGPLIARWLVDRGQGVTALLRGATWLTLASIAAFILTDAWTAMLLTVLVWGMGSGANWVLSSSEIQTRSPQGTVGRMSSFDQLSFTCGQALAALGAGALIDTAGGDARIGASVMVAAGAVFYVFLLRRTSPSQPDLELAPAE